MNSTTKGIDGHRPLSAYVPSQMRAELQTLDECTRWFVQERPYAAVLLMAAAGYLLARIASRY